MHTYSVRPNDKFWAQIHKFQSLRVTVVLCTITSLGTLYGYKQSISSRTAQCVYYQQKQLLRKNKRFLSFRNFFLSLSFVNFSVLGDIIRNSSICYLNFYGHLWSLQFPSTSCLVPLLVLSPHPSKCSLVTTAKYWGYLLRTCLKSFCSQ